MSVTEESSAAGTPSLVRLSVSAGGGRVDVGVPANTPVAELIPPLARALGQLSAEKVHGGFRLQRPGGGLLDDDRSLAAQGVDDGTALTLRSGADREEAKVYDDVVEAVADLVETQSTPWTPANAAVTALGAAVTFLLCGAAMLLAIGGDSTLVPVMAGVVAALLLLASAVLSRTPGQSASAVAVALTASPYAAITGAALAPDKVPFWGAPLAVVAGAVLVAGLVGLGAVRERREVLLAPAVSGLVLAIAGGVVAGVRRDVIDVFTVTFAVVVIAGNALPWLSLSSVNLRPRSPRSEAEIFAEVDPVDGEQVRDQFRRGQRTLVALTVAGAIVALVCAPHVVRTGVVGTVTATVGFVAILLRTRHSRTRGGVLTSMVAGIVGLAETAVAAALFHPDWRATLAVVLAVVAAVILGLALIAPRTRVRFGRIADALDLATMVALLPLALTAAGIISDIRS
jgi:type VII secretion integral membrane protein EccD